MAVLFEPQTDILDTRLGPHRSGREENAAVVLSHGSSVLVNRTGPIMQVAGWRITAQQ